VGKPYRSTPVFKANMKYLVFNPTWTVPPTILNKDILPAIRKNPNYLKERNIKVIDHKGKTIDQNTIDWSKYPKRRFPYLLRQEPGPKNALGLVKFMFPNKHLVYLHDTPSKSLFNRTDRAFSSGCIRVEEPFELAQRLLNDPARWNLDDINEVIKTKKTRTVHLPEPVPVILLYWTVAIDDKGIIYFKNDIYQRDGAILRGLNDEFKFRERPFGKQRPKL
jgi:murein L,D-transpeptidase YcbB/YkuD